MHSAKKKHKLRIQRNASYDKVLTRTHVGRGSTVELLDDRLVRRQPEVREVNLGAVVAHQDIFGLEIAMVYPEVVARLDSVDEGQERPPDQRVVADVHLPAYWLEEVAALAEVHDEVEVVVVFVCIVNRDDVRVVGDEAVERDFPARGGKFVLLPICFACDLDRASGGSAGCGGVSVDGFVNDAVSPRSQHPSEAKAPIYGAARKVWHGGGGGGRHSVESRMKRTGCRNN